MKDKARKANRPVPAPSPPGHYWPEHEPLPVVWMKARRQRLLPCPKCKRVTLDNMGQAAACTHSGNGLAYFRCRACGHRWKLSVQR